MWLWDVLDLSKPPVMTLTGFRGGHFNRLGTKIAAVASYSRWASPLLRQIQSAAVGTLHRSLSSAAHLHIVLKNGLPGNVIDF